MTQFPNQNKLPLFMFKPLTDFNVIAKFRAATSASTSVSSRLPVILLHKSSHIPNLLQV
jgi:hypothetical protein